MLLNIEGLIDSYQKFNYLLFISTRGRLFGLRPNQLHSITR